MNERIKELAEESGVFHCVNNETQKRYFVPEWIETEDIEYFVKVIINDCIGIIDDSVNHRIPASEYSNILKEHFGIE